MSDDYVMTRSNSRLADSLDSESVGYIQKRLKERSAFKAERQFDAADDIREELRSKFGVSIDDRTREWSVEVDQFTVVNGSASNRPDWGLEQIESTDDSIEDNSDTGFFETRLDVVDNNGARDDEIPRDHDGDDDGDDDDATSLANLTVPELKVKLKLAGLPVSGRKAELIDRLLAAQTQ
jgi:SAP domain